MTEFGITISCYRGDLPLLKGCLESIRSNLDPALPICMIQHGRFPLDALCRQYDCTVLVEEDVEPRLRRYSYGYGLTKMVAFWHAPFERFLHIDADAVCWGNLLEGVPWKDFDLIYNEPHEVITDTIQKSQYFDPDQVFPAFPSFPWKGLPFFNTGIFVGRRGLFDLEEYLALLDFQRRHPSALLCGDQGILNFMAFRKICAGTLEARSWPFQAVVPVISIEELRHRFAFRDGTPLVKPGDPRLIHWAGPKPYLSRKGPFPEPMTYYRLQHLRRIGSPRRHLGRIGLMLEEIDSRIGVAYGGSYARAARAQLSRMGALLGSGARSSRALSER